MQVCASPPGSRMRRCGRWPQVRRASDLPARRIHRQHRPEAARSSPKPAKSAARRSRDRSHARGRRISIAPIGRCCCECMAGGARPDPDAAARHLISVRAEDARRVRCRCACRCRISGPRGARPRPNAARLVRPRSRASSSARGGAAGFPHFGLHGFERHAHQRRGDFSLRFLVVGNADRGEDGFIQRRRVAPHAPGVRTWYSSLRSSLASC